VSLRGRRPRARHRNPLTSLLVAAAGLLVVLGAIRGLGPTAAIGGTPSADPDAPRPAASTTQDVSVPAIAGTIDPDLVDVDALDRARGVESAGTGMVLTASGEILTNEHVIAGATAITVTDLGNGRRYTATVVGQDSADDIAVLQARGASGLRIAPLGTSSGVAAGDAVVAVGNAGGQGGTPSAVAGTVVATDQPVIAQDETGARQTLTGMLEVRAAIEPGDSGGPLVDAGGQVVGMDTAATPGTSGAAGVRGYAIPIDRVEQVLRAAGIAG
jgi:S1-C subfamily serine protease